MLKFRWLAGIGWLALAAGWARADEPLPPPTKLAAPENPTSATTAGVPTTFECYTEKCVPRRMTCARLARAIEWLRRPKCEDTCEPRFCFNWWSRDWKCSTRLWAWGTYRPLCTTFPGACNQNECHPPLWCYFPPSNYNKPLAPVPCDDRGWDWPILSFLFRSRGCDSCDACGPVARPRLFGRSGCRTCSSGTCATPAVCPTGCAGGTSACEGSRAAIVASRVSKMPVLPPSVFRKCAPEPVIADTPPPPVIVDGPVTAVPEPLPMPRK